MHGVTNKKKWKEGRREGREERREREYDPCKKKKEGERELKNLKTMTL